MASGALESTFELIDDDARTVNIKVTTDVHIGRSVGEDSPAYVLVSLQGRMFAVRKSAGGVRKSPIRSRAQARGTS